MNTFCPSCRSARFVHRDEICERADRALVRAAIDVVPDAESPHTGPDPNDFPSDVVAQGEWHPVGQDELELASADLGVEQVDPGRVDLDQHLAVARHRFWHVR
jgi:hypothetical protein